MALVAIVAIGAWGLLHRHAARQVSAPAGLHSGDTAVGVPERPSRPDRDSSDSRTRKSTKRSPASNFLPPPGTPLRQIYNEQRARADAGDGAAATRLYHDVARCSGARGAASATTQFVSSELAREASTMSAAEADRHDRMLQYLIERDKATAAMCAGASDEQIDSTMPVMLRAAQLGDLNALDCYIGSDLTTRKMLDHPAWLMQYEQNAPVLIDVAMQHGDWAVVELMRQIYAGSGFANFSESLRRQLVDADPVMSYRYLRLEQHGAQGDLAESLRVNATLATRELTPEQVAESDSWALDEYDRYFTSKPVNDLFNGTDICEIDDN